MRVDEHSEYRFSKFKADERSKESKNYKQLMPYFL
jgi:hypothetical protein